MHLVTAGMLLVGWVIGRLGTLEALRYRDWDLLVKVVTIFRRANHADWGL